MPFLRDDNLLFYMNIKKCKQGWYAGIDWLDCKYIATNNFSHVFIIELKKKGLVPDAQTLKNRKNFRLNFQINTCRWNDLRKIYCFKKSLLMKYLIYMLLKQKLLENIYRNTFESYIDRCTYYDKLMLWNDKVCVGWNLWFR